MDSESTMTEIAVVENLLNQYASIPYAHGTLQGQTIFDRERQRFLLLTIGWDGDKRIHNIVVDIEIRENKFWIHRDGLEEGIVADLEEHGISKDRIVLAWFPEIERQYTEYAIR